MIMGDLLQKVLKNFFVIFPVLFHVSSSFKCSSYYNGFKTFVCGFKNLVLLKELYILLYLIFNLMNLLGLILWTLGKIQIPYL